MTEDFELEHTNNVQRKRRRPRPFQDLLFFQAGPVPKVPNSYPNLLFSVLFFLSLSARKEGEDVEREEGRGGTLIKFLPHREFLRPPAPPSENKYEVADY